MDKSNQLMKWIMFWVFMALFTLAVLGTLGVVFLGFGTPTEAEREWLVKGLIIEVAACIVALFYSMFGLKPETTRQQFNVEQIESRISELESKILLTTEKISSDTTMISIDKDEKTNNSDLMSQMFPHIARLKEYDVPPPFEVNEYNLSPSYEEIDDDISRAKPFDKEHRRKSYYGLKVQWKGAYKSISEKQEYYRVHLDSEKPMSGIYIIINKQRDISKLKFLDEGHPIWVCGEIADLAGPNVELANADFYTNGV